MRLQQAKGDVLEQMRDLLLVLEVEVLQVVDLAQAEADPGDAHGGLI